MIIMLGFFLGSFLAVVALRSLRCIAIWERPQWPSPSSQMRLYRATWAYLWGGRSRCDACGHRIRFYENIPLFSFLFLRGRCAQCHTPIPWALFHSEWITLLVAVWIFLFIPEGPLQWCVLALFALLWLIAWIDFDKLVIPDVLSYAVFWLGVYVLSLEGAVRVVQGLWVAVACYVMIKALQQFYLWVRRRDALGDADPLLAFALGVWLQPQWVPFFFMGAALFTLVLAAWRGRSERSIWDTPIPFGPGLALAGWVLILVQLGAPSGLA